jgi:hypothetical protein
MCCSVWNLCFKSDLAKGYALLEMRLEDLKTAIALWRADWVNDAISLITGSVAAHNMPNNPEKYMPNNSESDSHACEFGNYFA